MIKRLVYWLNKAITGKEKPISEHQKDGDNNIKWIKQLKTTLNELLEVLSDVPDEIKEGVLNYLISRISKVLYPFKYKHLSRSSGIFLYDQIEQDKNDEIDQMLPMIYEKEKPEAV